MRITTINRTTNKSTIRCQFKALNERFNCIMNDARTLAMQCECVRPYTCDQKNYRLQF